MSYDFTYNNVVVGKLYALKYRSLIINTYNFTYDRNITSDLDEYNSPIFLSLEARRVVLNNDNFVYHDPKDIGFNPSLKIIPKQEYSIDIITQGQSVKELYEKPELALFKYIFLSHTDELHVFRQNLLLKDNQTKELSIFTYNSLSHEIPLNYYNSYIFGANLHTDLNVFNQSWFKVRYRDVLTTNKIYPAQEININNLSVYNKLFGAYNMSENKYGYIFDSFNSLYKKEYDLYIQRQSMSFEENIINANIYKDYLLHNTTILNTNINNLYSFNIDSKNIFLHEGYNITSNNSIDVYISDIFFLTSGNKNTLLNKYNLSLSINSKDLFLRDGFSAYKDYEHSTTIFDNNHQIFKDRLSFSIDEYDGRIYRILKRLNEEITFDPGRLLFRKRLGSVVNEENLFAHREKYSFVIDDISSVIENESRKPSIYIDDNNSSLLKNNIDTYLNRRDKSLYKTQRQVKLDVKTIELDKYVLPLYIDYDNGVQAFIVDSRNAYYDKDNIFFTVLSKEIFCKDLTESLEKEGKAITPFFKDIFVIKDTQKAFLERFGLYNVIHKDRHALHTIFDDTFVDKDAKYITLERYNTSVSKNLKDAFLTKNISVDKKLKDAFLQKDVRVDKVLKTTILEKWNTNIIKNSKITNFFEDVTITKQIFNAFCHQDFFAMKESYQISQLDNGIFIDKLGVNTTYGNNILSLTDGPGELNVNSSYLLIDRTMYEAYINKTEIEDLQKIHKDLSNPNVQNYNWAYVYQFDDPIDPNYDYYGIDELLLPEEDVNYSYYEDLIFDKKNLRPKNAIKINEDGSYIAKLPITHPTPEYSDVAVQYIDIPSELMREIYIAFFRIWYANIFKFGNMQMIDSLKLMLKYIYTYIIETYTGTQYLKEALRVFRQIRWFGEKSVLNNARYIVKPIYTDYDANDDLLNGICKIPYNAKNFEIDTLRRGFELVYSSSPNYSLEFTIANKSTIILNINMAVVNCDVDVYVDGIFQCNIDGKSGRIKKNLEYEIEKKLKTDYNKVLFVVNNVDIVGNSSQVLIANVKVHNFEFSHLSIEYDPELRNGNVPMDEIVKKMVIFANMCDDHMINEAYQQYRKGNLAISELYKEMARYWELHHQNKIKGKRLTIKET